MRDPENFRGYAEQCRRLASKMPEHRDTLLAMAAAWIVVAERLEQRGAKAKRSPQNGKDSCSTS